MKLKTDNSKYIKGIIAEKIARMYLRLKGYKIVENRLRTPAGEVDILAKKGDFFIVVEVKYRKKEEDALYAITNVQQKRLYRAGGWVMQKYDAHSVRFDAILVSSAGVKHILNAFGQE